MQVKDLLDILLVAAVLYLLLVWLRLSLPHGVARRSMIAAPIAAIVYALAQAFDLYLLEHVLEGLLIVVLVGAVVVYQTDIRRLLDRAFTGRAAGLRSRWVR
jgi:DNA integrity scanning protein DisA with diadenylate cyclase activity